MAELHNIEMRIDGQVVTASEGETVLSVAARNKIDIPSLCHHEALKPYGACRLCLVEITKPSGLDKGERDVVAACQYPVSEGLSVQTRSERVLRHRRVVVSLLLARAPEAPVFQDLARRLGGAIPFRPAEVQDNCILCALCTRTCAAIGVEAICASGRGYEKRIEPPFVFGEGGCVGCGACHRICPTGCIPMSETDETRTIWGHTFERARCARCGAPLLTKAHLAFAARQSGLDPRCFTLCAACKQMETATTFAALSSPLGAGR